MISAQNGALHSTRVKLYLAVSLPPPMPPHQIFQSELLYRSYLKWCGESDYISKNHTPPHPSLHPPSSHHYPPPLGFLQPLFCCSTCLPNVLQCLLCLPAVLDQGKVLLLGVNEEQLCVLQQRVRVAKPHPHVPF